ncbi:NIBL1 protein, partial [Pedionomus torquatus]|nr:NIBL1 protein [Pedionomus torquatus]
PCLTRLRSPLAEKTGKVLGEFCRCYKEQYGVALFNSVRYEIEGNGGPQAQLLHRKVPLEDHVIYSGNLFQYIEENKKWRNRFCVVPHNYGLVLYENKLAYERELPPRVLINSAGYKVLTSVDQYLELVNNSLPGVTPKSGHSPILKCPTDFPLILWHPYARHYYFCVMTGKEQEKWRAVFQDCVRHCNNEAPAFTDAVRMYRQSKEHYGTWDMLCGNETQVRTRQGQQEAWWQLTTPFLSCQISDAVYRMVYEQTKAQYDAAMAKCEQERPQMESTIRTDMDQIITSKEHLASKIRAFVLPKAEICVRNHVQPYISSILEALMTPTSQGFAEVREVFFKEVTDMNMNIVNEGGLEKLAEYMEKLSHLAFHPVKMQSCYEKMDQLKLEGLQQRFDVSSTSVFKQRAQIHMRQQMDDAVYTFETLLHQELGKLQGKDDLCKSIQRILERVLKVRGGRLGASVAFDGLTPRARVLGKRTGVTFMILLEVLYLYIGLVLLFSWILLGCGAGTCCLVSSAYLTSLPVSPAVKEAAVQRKHNLYRDSMVMHNSDPNLHLLGEGVPIDWGEEYSGQPEPELATEKRRRAKQVVSVIQDDEGVLPYEVGAEALLQPSSPEPREPEEPDPGAPPSSPDGVEEIREALAQESLASPKPRADVPSEATMRCAAPASPKPRADVPSEAKAPQVTPASSPAPGAETPSLPAGMACHQPSDKETGEEVATLASECSPLQPMSTTESGEGVQTEF